MVYKTFGVCQTFPCKCNNSGRRNSVTLVLYLLSLHEIDTHPSHSRFLTSSITSLLVHSQNTTLFRVHTYFEYSEHNLGFAGLYCDRRNRRRWRQRFADLREAEVHGDLADASFPVLDTAIDDRRSVHYRTVSGRRSTTHRLSVAPVPPSVRRTTPVALVFPLPVSRGRREVASSSVRCWCSSAAAVCTGTGRSPSDGNEVVSASRYETAPARRAPSVELLIFDARRVGCTVPLAGLSLAAIPPLCLLARISQCQVVYIDASGVLARGFPAGVNLAPIQLPSILLNCSNHVGYTQNVATVCFDRRGGGLPASDERIEEKNVKGILQHEPSLRLMGCVVRRISSRQIAKIRQFRQNSARLGHYDPN